MKNFISSLLVAITSICFSTTLIAAESTGYSQAQMLLFDTAHLKNIVSASELYYDFKQSGSKTDALNDKIVMSITSVHENGKNITPTFLSGKNKRRFAPVQGFTSNILVMHFLQWDVEMMMKKSGVHHHTFRKILRGAFLTGANTQEIKVPYKGKQIPAHVVQMTPIKSKKAQASFSSTWNKQYEFVIADVPGGIYRISTTIPGQKPTDPPVEYTEITFNRIEPNSAFDTKGEAK